MSYMPNKHLSNFAPAYAAIYPKLSQIIQRHGYAAAVHGSMTRDFDVVCIPWTPDASPMQEVVDELTGTFGLRHIESPAKTMAHGRVEYKLCIAFGECVVDLSFMPRTPA